jgi:branched-subunit amino acid aminotransferase/4-amino-4-deoxychorismate lyase
MGFVWCDGDFLPINAFRVSPFDRGLCHGMSVFETLLAVDGEPRLLAPHLDRLRSGLERLAVSSVELSGEGLRRAMVGLLEKNGLTHGMARIRLAVSLGAGPLNITDSGVSWAWMTATPVDDMPETVRVTTAPWRRDRENVLRGLKVGNYAEHLIAMDMARREGFGEMLFFNNDDELCEAAMANVFLIRSGSLLTPSLDSGCLAGVTRSLVIRLAAAHGIPCREKPLTRNDVAKAEGMFLTSSIRGPVRVSAYGGQHFDEHPLFDAVRAIWLEEMAKGSE